MKKICGTKTKCTESPVQSASQEIYILLVPKETLGYKYINAINSK